MGIEGLLSLVKPVIKYGHISMFANKTAAIDAMVWLYRGAYSCALELGTKTPTITYLLLCYKMIQLFKKWNIKPIFCVDGRHLMAKERTNMMRSQKKETEKEKASKLLDEGNVESAKKYFTRSIKITKKMIYRLIDMLRLLQIDYIIAPYESDAQVSFLCKNGAADFAISEDSDLLCYNCPTVLYKLGVYGECEYVELKELREKRRNKEKLGNDNLNTLFSLSEENFTYVCIMAGCDYLPSIKGMGLKKALKFFDKFGNLDSVIRRIRIERKFMGNVPTEYEKTVRRVANIFLYQLVYNPNEKKLTTLTPRDDFEAFVQENKYFIGELIPNIEKYVLGKINLKTSEEREFENFDLQTLIGNRKSFELDTKPTTQDYVNRAMIDMKNQQKFSQQIDNAGSRKNTPAITLTQPETTPIKKNAPVDLNEFDFDVFFQDYLENFEEELKSPEEKNPKKDSSHQMNLKPNEKAVDNQIDFLFLICKEYSRGIDDNSNQDRDPILKKSTQKTEKASPYSEKPSNTFKMHLNPPIFEEEFDLDPSPKHITRVLEQEDDMIDSFRKLKTLDKKKPSPIEKENLKSQQIITPSKSSPTTRKESHKSANKRKLNEVEEETKASNSTKKAESEKKSVLISNDEALKKTKVSPSQVSNQPKISVFFQKNKL